MANTQFVTRQIADSAVTSDKIAATAVSTGLTGGAGSPLAVNLTAGSLTFSGAAVWTFPADNLQITGTPNSANDAVNKTYADSLVSGLTWVNPVTVTGLVGNDTAANISALTPSAGDTYVCTDFGNINPGLVSAVPGTVVQYNGSMWVLIDFGTGTFVSAGVRATLSTTVALIAPYTDGVDDGNIVSFDGTTLTGADTGEAADGSAFVVNGDSYYENIGFVFDGIVPAGTWVQFTGAGSINSGAGLVQSGNTINVGAGTGITVNADDIEVKLYATLVTAVGSADVSNNPIYKDATNGLNIKIDNSTVGLDAGNGYRLYVPNAGITATQIAAAVAGNGISGGAGTALALDVRHEDVVNTGAATSTLTSTPFTTTGGRKAALLTVNGQVLTEGGAADYTISGSTITWVGAPPSGDVVNAFFFV